MSIQLEKSWFEVLKNEFDKDYMINLMQFLQKEAESGQEIYPESADIFNAFDLTPFNDAKVVILGQDPYHGKGQAHGLSFSVKDGIKLPPSLKNIYKELETDISDFKTPTSGNLSKWAKQGILLLNATLTVNAGSPGSHQKQGWETFTDEVIKTISDQKKGVVFILWGKYAQQKLKLIDESKHFTIASAHPSPFSAYNGFFGSKPFSKTNEILRSTEKKEIDWQIEHQKQNNEQQVLIF